MGAMIQELKSLEKRVKVANAKTWVLLISVAVLLLIGTGSCIWLDRVINEKRQLELSNSYLRDTVASQKVIILKDSTRLLDMDVRYSTEKDARIVAEDKVKDLHGKLKRVTAVVTTKFDVEAKNIVANYSKPSNKPRPDSAMVQNISGCDSLLSYMQKNTIPIGTQFSYYDSSKYVSGVIGADNVAIDSLGFTNLQATVIIGQVKQGLFKKAKPSVVVKFNSPYINDISGNNVIVKDTRKKPLLLSRTAMLLYGFVLGAVLIN
jgi:hypothetical protein